jgi:8-oxo-dGTP pyrophosphatase MutT (NUDIX family)
MAHLEKTGEYKFPGGGVEENETSEEALKREVLEEVGYNTKIIGEKIGSITEFGIAKEGGNNIFKMISEYYMVEIDNEPLKQKLDDYEQELMFKPCWVEIETAYNTNREILQSGTDATPWIKRETMVLELLTKNMQSNL